MKSQQQPPSNFEYSSLDKSQLKTSEEEAPTLNDLSFQDHIIPNSPTSLIFESSSCSLAKNTAGPGLLKSPMREKLVFDSAEQLPLMQGHPKKINH